MPTPDMTNAESIAMAEALLADHCWRPHPKWGRYCHGTYVAGIAPNGPQYLKDWARIAPGDPLHGADTPDTPHEAARWLIDRYGGANAVADAVSQSCPSDDAENWDTPEAFGGDDVIPLSPDDAEEAKPANPDVYAIYGEAGPLPAIGADRIKAMPLLGQSAARPSGGEPEWTDSPLSNFGGADRFYGLDDLDRRRSLRIGDVVRISIAKQAEIWALSGGSQHEHDSLQGAIVRDIVDGVYRGSQAAYDRFTHLATYSNAANAVAAVEREKVRFLNEAGRADVETFDATAGWPESTL